MLGLGKLGRHLALRVPPVRRMAAERDRLRARSRRLETDLESARNDLRRERETRATTTQASQQGTVAELTSRLTETRQTNVALLRDSRDLVRAEDQLGSLRYLFIVSYGRSGSTLLQGILNTIPGYLIRGENRNALNHLFNYHRDLRRESERHLMTADTHRSPWWGIDQYADQAVVVRLRQLVVQTLLRPQEDTEVIGFKEIRWWHEDWQGYQDFLLELFPGARFVFNSRNHADVAKSKWWIDDPNPAKQLARFEQRLTDMAERLGPDRAFQVSYDDYAQDPETLRPLFSWLDAPYEQEKIQQAMGIRYSY